MVDPQRGPSGSRPTEGSQGAGRRGTEGKGSTKKVVSPRRKWTFRILKAIGALLVLGLISATAIVVIGYQTTNLPRPNEDFGTETTFVYYNDGKTQLGSFAIQNRQPLTLKEMPDSIKKAIVAAENRSFWTDKGISFRGMFRAAYVIARGGNLQGGSTITQQYIKIMYLKSDQTLARKFRELFLAYKINKNLSKEEILEGYLNTIYFGRGAYGIQAASKSYFGVDAKKLSLPQAAVLASVLNNPSMFDPSADDDNAERLLGRYRYVLTSMAETGDITADQAAEYSAKLPTFPDIPINERYGGPKGFLLKMVERELSAAGFDPAQVSGGGLRITTTFEKSSQDAAVKSAQKFTKEAAEAADEKASQLHAALASVEVGTGEVLALYGGPDFVENSRNWATTARPTASTFKTYALAAGLKDGYSLRSVFNGNTFTPPGDSGDVRNEFRNQYGPVSLVRATAESINTAFVDLTVSMDQGPDKVSEMAQAAGAPKGRGWDLNNRISLGTAEVSPLAHAGAYATFANDGAFVANHVVREVKNAKGKVLYKAKKEEKRAVSADIAHDVTYALQDVVEQGTGRTVQTLNRPVAGKTGTKDVQDDITAAWFVAYTKQISTAVMYVAGDSGSEDLDAYRRPGDKTFFGGTYPALTWADYMQKVTEGMPVKQFDEPAYVNGGQAPAPQPTRTRPVDPSPTETGNVSTESPAQTPTRTDESNAGPTPTATGSATAPTTTPSSTAPSDTAPPTTVPPTSGPPTTGPPTSAPPSSARPTKSPPTSAPPSSARPTKSPPSSAPPTRSSPTRTATRPPTSRPTTRPSATTTSGNGPRGEPTGGG